MLNLEKFGVTKGRSFIKIKS